MSAEEASASALPLATIQSAVERIKRVPDAYRQCDQTATDAKRAHGISAGLLSDLLDGGIPHRVAADGGLYMDELDLANASSQLALPSARAMALRSWVVALKSARESSGCAYRVTFQPRCPEPGHSGVCHIGQPEEVASVIGRTTTVLP